MKRSLGYSNLWLLIVSSALVTFSVVHVLATPPLQIVQSTSPVVDSLRQALEQHHEKDKEYAMTLLRLSSEISESDPQQSLDYAQEVITLAKQLGDQRVQALALNIQGICYLYEDQYGEAFQAFAEAIPLFQEVGDGLRLGNGYNNASLVFKHLGDYPQSLAYLSRAEHIYDSIGYQVGIARANNNLGNLFMLQNDLDQAEQHYQRAFQIHTDRQSAHGRGIAQLNLGILYAQKEEYERSRLLLDSALDYFTQNNIRVSRVTALNTLGEISVSSVKNTEVPQRKTSAYTQAEQYFSIALTEAEELKMTESRAEILANLARLAANQGNTAPSIRFAEQVKVLADSINSPSIQANAEELLFHVFQQAGQYQTALQHHQQYTDWKDSIFNEQMAAQYKSQQVQREVAQKDRELDKQASQLVSLNERVALENRWKWTLAGASLLLLLTGVLYYQRAWARKQYAQQVEASKKQLEEVNRTINYFADSLFGKNTVEEVLWDVAKNCISRLG
ncbi:MAG: tetratricopeptide repeat protein, partial [Bacteroidota bacterium]